MPWELLADEEGFLAADAERRYAPARRLGLPKPPPALDEYRLGVAFMAAAPRGVRELDFEAEEAAIMTAASRDLDLLVEEGGNAEELGRRLARLKPTLPVLHLSCHGDNAWRDKDGKAPPQSVVFLEDPTGAQLPATAGTLLDALGAYRPNGGRGPVGFAGQSAGARSARGAWGGTARWRTSRPPPLPASFTMTWAKEWRCRWRRRRPGGPHARVSHPQAGPISA